MMRWLTILLAATVLTGCVTTREVVYREPYREGVTAYDETYYRDGNSYYSPTYEGYGDYYGNTGYSGSTYYGPSYYSYGASYFDYPYYYSIFWPINRWYYDPFYYPGYYYGVTWFPRSYFSLSYAWGGPHYRSWLSYSPYRYSWVDSYYDWGHWYNRYPNYRNYYPTPRYGDARVEASRLASMNRPYSTPSRPGAYGQSVDRNSGRAVAPANSGNRAAIPRGSYGNTRPGVYSSGVTSPSNVRRVGAGSQRVEPSTGLFGNPTRPGSTAPGNRLNDARPRSESRGELDRYSGARDATPIRSGNLTGPTNMPPRAPVRESLPVQNRSRAPDTSIPVENLRITPVAPNRSGTATPQPVIRNSQPVRSTLPTQEIRSAPVREYSGPNRGAQAPARVVVPARPSGNSYAPAPAPVRAAPSSPSRQSESAPTRSSTSSGTRSSDSSVRRVGSNREH